MPYSPQSTGTPVVVSPAVIFLSCSEKFLFQLFLMDDLQTSDALTFLPEQIEPVVFEAIESVLKDKIYHEKLVQGWVWFSSTNSFSY